MLHILKLRTVNKWKTKFDCVILHLKRARAAQIMAAKIRYRRTLTCVATSNFPPVSSSLVKCEECEWQEPELPLYLAFERIFLYQRNFLLK